MVVLQRTCVIYSPTSLTESYQSAALTVIRTFNFNILKSFTLFEMLFIFNASIASSGDDREHVEV